MSEKQMDEVQKEEDAMPSVLKEDETQPASSMPTCSTFFAPKPDVLCPGRGAKRMKTSDALRTSRRPGTEGTPAHPRAPLPARNPNVVENAL